MRILIVEDELQIAKMYEFKLSSSGFEVMCSYNGQDGLEAAERYRPELILLDLMMPIMDGAEMLKSLREKKWGSKIKVIVLTNISRDEAPSYLRFLNVDRYVVKAHYTPSQVVDIIKEVMNIK